MTNCQFFDRCGGCDLLNFGDEDYQKFKQKDFIQKYKIEPDEWIFIGPKSRRKITLQVNKNNQIGFFAKRSKEIVAIDSCFISEEKLSQFFVPLQQFLNKFSRGKIAKITITSFDNILDLIFHLKADLDFNENEKLVNFSQENKVNISCKNNDKILPILLKKKNQIIFNNLKLDLIGDIFIQATKGGLEKIISEINNFIIQKNINKIIDIYAGFGAYSFAISQNVKEILALEGSAEMTNLIKENARKNNLGQKIIAQNQDLFSNPLTKEDLKNFDAAIINPPRNGALPQIKEIAKSNLPNLIYVSCNPQSFFRDFEQLQKNNFKIEKLIALDQFYGSKHLEIIAIAKK